MSDNMEFCMVIFDFIRLPRPQGERIKSIYLRNTEWGKFIDS